MSRAAKQLTPPTMVDEVSEFGESSSARVKFQTKAEATYGELRRRILDGSISPGSSLNQDRLALDLGVSTTPLREAIRRLESEGLLSFSAHREVVVSSVQMEGLIDLYEVREAVDALAVKLAAARHTLQEAELIRQACKSLRKSAAMDPLALNRVFHRVIYSSCHNRALIEELENLWDRSDRHRRLLLTVALDREVVHEHLAIAEAVLERDGTRAASLMARHVRDARKAIQQRVSSGTDQ
ncbi:MAG: GntR family transcriptional regulator [Actinomycetota bacterium]|nr:GntR family transcriptional regulator [Actinomycetota bacterium]